MDKKIQLVPDIACNLDQENIDLMGTSPYVDVLEKIVEDNLENHTSFTVGLFGGWGSGKSSIINTLFERLSSKDISRKVKTVIYDAWKYSGDAFRRSFILELKDQLELEWEENLEVFYKEKHKDVSTTIRVTKKWWVIPLCIIPILATLVWVFNPGKSVVNGAITFLSVFTSCMAIILSHALTKHKISVTTPKIFSPEQFKEIFDQAIYDTTGENHPWYMRWWVHKGKGCEKVVVVIDNIDRCDKKTAKELLLNIKTYLENKRCIVIVPIDDEAMKSHLEYSGDDEAEEFLRKIFNVSIRIKGLNNIDRYDFTKKLIEKYSLEFSNEVASVISQEFAKNPRRIIQFLNSLVLEREVAREQEAKGLIPEGSVTKNIDFLAKVLLIKQAYPFLYDAIISNRINLVNWEELYTEDNHPEEKRELQMFLGRTSGLITPQNIMPFLLLHSKNDVISPEFINFIQAGQAQEVMEKIEKESIDFNNLLNYLDNMLDSKLIIREVTANPELNFLLWCFSKDKINKTLIEREASFFRYFSYIHQKNIESFSFSDLTKTARHLKQNNQIGLYDTIISYIQTTGAALNLSTVLDFIKIFDSQNDLLNIKDTINKLLGNELSHFEILLPYLKEKDLSPDYIQSEIFTKYLSTLSAKRTNDDTKICQAVKSCILAHMLPEDAHETFLQSVLGFLNTEQSPACYTYWLEQVKGCLLLTGSGSQLFKWLQQVFNSPVFPNRADAQWKKVLQAMVLMFEEYIILGETSGWKSLSMAYLLEDDWSVTTNNSLKEIVKKTTVDKWIFLDDVVKKTTNTNVPKEHFAVTGEILQKGKGQLPLSGKPELLKNWLNFVITKEEIEEHEQKILQMYCKEDIFNSICQQNVNLARSLFDKCKSLPMKEVIDSIAKVILQNASSPSDVKYLVEQQCEHTDAMKSAIKQGIEIEGENEFEWMTLVIDTDDFWSKKEYKDLLEERLLHLATGSNDQKEQANQVWARVNKDKISKNKVKIIEEGISEEQKEIVKEDIDKEDEVEKE